MLTRNEATILKHLQQIGTVSYTDLSVYNGVLNARKNRQLIATLTKQKYIDPDGIEKEQSIFEITERGFEALNDYLLQDEKKIFDRISVIFSSIALLFSAISLLLDLLK